MTREWERKLAALFLAVFAIVAHATAAPASCSISDAHVPYCAAETLAMPSSPITIPVAVLPAATALTFAFLVVVFFTTIRDDGRTRLALLRRSGPDSDPWTHRHRTHLAPLASPHGD